MESFKLSSFGHSDIGLIRRNNEDVFLQLPEHHCFLLADGMGGHNAGEVAAKETVVYFSDCVDKLFKKNQPGLTLEQLKKHLEFIIHRSNERIYHLGKENHAFNGMGTTLSAILFFENSVICTHVGDSRIYRYRKKNLCQLSQDHTLKNKLLQQGLLEKAIKDGIRYKNVLTNAIGAFKRVSPEISVHPLMPGDLYLICSDGLSDFVTDPEICCILDHQVSLKEITYSLIDKAKQKGSCDNITVVLTHIES